ncbi:MAG: PorT family protein, partial [Rikenellaceae bacterium]|nr:PorT family protein [Rikenellaceae bacterium]
MCCNCLRDCFGSGVQVRVKAGFGLSTNSIDLADRFSDAGIPSMKKINPGFYAGALAEYGFSDKFAVQFDLVYSAQWANYKLKESIMGVAKINMNTSYLNLPIVAKYYVIDKLDSEAGPQFGLLLAARMKASVKV